MSKIRYYAADISETKNKIREALSYKLFVSGFFMKEWFLASLSLRSNKKCLGRPFTLVTIAYYDNDPIGVCFIYGCIISIYVKPFWRKCGIGTNLIKCLLAKYPIQGTFIAGKGITGSEKFYAKNKLPAYNLSIFPKAIKSLKAIKHV